MKTRFCILVLSFSWFAAAAQTPLGAVAQPQLQPPPPARPVAQAAQTPKASDAQQRRQEVRNAVVARQSQTAPSAQNPKALPLEERHLTPKERVEMREQLRQQRQLAKQGQQGG